MGRMAGYEMGYIFLNLPKLNEVAASASCSLPYHLDGLYSSGFSKYRGL